MKKVFISLLLFVGITLFSQEKFDCNNLSKTDYLNKYRELRSYGLDKIILKDGTEVIPLVINKVYDENSLRQVCINAAYDDHKFGTENSYILYRNNIYNLSRETFMKNSDYFQIFLEMIANLKNQ
ncbi:MAG: hypothetical protein DI622_08170 [Chryseobacterium sp.]|uniref:hypothetical protein n=1 Tax=Chryseobacterium sp. TaxID=1871047 RepID=UPI000DAFF837|nr:hypothetical protein [Chryseobacterium sp.]MPS65974.1 hypothetical protein [Chryseobacterium sp.]PZU20273.1 MAG: hypothetical protein DI622_08170 [Chryseobacterium sp.]